MKHAIRVRRHILRDFLSFIAGGALIAAILERAWLPLVLSVLNGVALFVEERADIEEEETE